MASAHHCPVLFYCFCFVLFLKLLVLNKLLTVNLLTALGKFPSVTWQRGFEGKESINISSTERALDF